MAPTSSATCCPRGPWSPPTRRPTRPGSTPPPPPGVAEELGPHPPGDHPGGPPDPPDPPGAPPGGPPAPPDSPGDPPGGPPDPPGPLPAALELVPAGPVAMRLAAPASKSVTNRALLCAALAEGTSHLRGAAASDDAEAMTTALGQLGARVELRPGTWTRGCPGRPCGS